MMGKNYAGSIEEYCFESNFLTTSFYYICLFCLTILLLKICYTKLSIKYTLERCFILFELSEKKSFEVNWFLYALYINIYVYLILQIENNRTNVYIYTKFTYLLYIIKENWINHDDDCFL